MYIVKLKNRKLTSKMFQSGFNTYEAARNALRKYLRSLGLGRNHSELQYSIQKN